MTATTPKWHTHDLRIGAREYEGRTVRAWQVYCVICDEAGRIVLPALAAPAPGAAREGEALRLLRALVDAWRENWQGDAVPVAFAEARAFLAARVERRIEQEPEQAVDGSLPPNPVVAGRSSTPVPDPIALAAALHRAEGHAVYGGRQRHQTANERDHERATAILAALEGAGQ